MTTTALPQTLTLNLWGCPRYRGQKGLCQICGCPVRGRRRTWCSEGCVDLYLDNHNWARAAWVAKVRAGQRCQRCGNRGYMETNHIRPVNGMSREGCASHQDGLEVLCHECHGTETARQRQEGLIG